MTDIVPRSYWRFPALPSLWDDEEDWGAVTNWPSGLSLAEDESHVFVQAAVPGVDPKDIEVTVDHGVVWIKGESKEEETDKKYYRKAASSFSYRVTVPGDIDTTKDPVASVKNGVMTVTFTKSPKAQPKKISVREEK
jgi:HSP20 family protein